MSRGYRADRGVTLVELLVVVAILAILQFLAVPAFRSLLQVAQLNSVADSLFSHLLLTRSEAIRRNGRLVLCKSFSGLNCATSGGWEQGWIVFHDANENARVDPSEVIVSRMQAFPSHIKVAGNFHVESYVSYLPSGRTGLISGALQAGTLTLCVRSPSQTEARQIVITSSGRLRAQRTMVNYC